ncbi:hypothetical protein [Candidatus Venteria ishoeyi]|uniref:2-dehydropantoate 2-reductase n=1 Tax=Candidatus Venteria ishoeyi TaxID=1899563 RepID=A0A1H6FF07_9GAMM|nr:hypothetical protein [Candidatus Venteria ishoeyi]MDM8544986.1 hypothetical protein [Candidatus Venteria ishoeyi]SEH07756.1 Uncharacterised protein [Candidatus Venteria ishoeyi]
MTYPSPVILVGLGEMGGVFARGFLRAGYPVYPVTRNTDLSQTAQLIPQPQLVLLATGEQDLHPLLKHIPEHWRTRLVLLQNELLPKDWQQHDLDNPTVISVWFEKKPGQDFKVIIPSPVYGPQAQVIADSLGSLSIPVRVLKDKASLLFELVRKNLYILTSNIAGIKVGGNVGQLWEQHHELAESVASEVLELQAFLSAEELPQAHLINAMVEAFDNDPEHQCMGRSAPGRLQRALEIADRAGLDVPVLRQIQKLY